eukprot:scaffold3120_cov167-Ochromonas_danica.AAC.6
MKKRRGLDSPALAAEAVIHHQHHLACRWLSHSALTACPPVRSAGLCMEHTVDTPSSSSGLTQTFHGMTSQTTSCTFFVFLD